MTARSTPDRDTLLMMLSAYLDGELPASDEPTVLDALSQDSVLLEAFEAMSAARANFEAPLSADESADLTASVMAATAPEQMPATEAGALELAHLFVDDCLDDRGHSRLTSMLAEKPALAPALAGFVASTEAVQMAARAVGQIPSVVESLRMVPDHVAAQVAARERLFTLASADLDAALTSSESSELEALLAREPGEVLAFASAVHAGEALRLTSSSPVFMAAARTAGEAALHAIEAERLQAKPPVAAAKPMEARDTLIARLWRTFAPARAPLAFAAAAAAFFFVVSGPAPVARDVVADCDATRDALVKELAPQVLAEGPAPGELPLLADNSADVEAIDATNTTVVFSTDSSNITVIWVDSDEQGT